ncbi:hypothetical protein ZIOFF_068988 [Zingiber officinale]|uniref:Protein kinase domain-containing protein n=1 Tax=Zingiber officinale TaxID=94328 RepID=A0A8J5EPK5_ZINOF|nr:hypothetical protein ZIOFF_068988 [Zingiber officinale]
MEMSATVDDSPRAKFLCSFGGSILPRPLDGRLRYVGGETRIVTVPRDISYEVFLARMRELFDGVSIIKYQQPDEDLDALVSIVNDEDVMNMMEEYDKLMSAGDGPTWLRIFLFSHYLDQESTTISMNYDADNCEQRYIDAINSLVDAQSPSPPDISEHYFGHPSIDGEIPDQVTLRQLNIPSHEQRYGEMDTPRSPALYSPRRLVANDPQEFSSSPTSDRFHLGVGEFSDRIPDDYYIRQTGGHHMHHYDHHSPTSAESFGWIPTGAVVQEKSGFPANLGHSHNMIEVNGVCEHCHMTFQRNHGMPDARFQDTHWRHGPPYMEQQNMANEYMGFPNSSAEFYNDRDSFMANRDIKVGHGVYLNEQHPILNESHNHEYGWAIHNNQYSHTHRLEDMRIYQNGINRISEHNLDGNMINIPFVQGNTNDEQSFPSNCVTLNESYIRHGAITGNENFLPQHTLGSVPNANMLVAEDTATRYHNQLSAYGFEGPFQGTHNLRPIQPLWIKRQVPAHPGTSSHDLTSSMIPNGVERGFTRYMQEGGSPRFSNASVEGEIRNAMLNQNNNLPHRMIALKESSFSDYAHQDGMITNPSNINCQDGDLLTAGFSSTHTKVPLEAASLVPSFQINKDPDISGGTEAHRSSLQMQAAEGKNIAIADEPEANIAFSPKSSRNLEFSLKELRLSEKEESIIKHLGVENDVTHGDGDMSEENLTFLPELIASVKKAVLEGAEEVVAMVQSNSELVVSSTQGKKESVFENKPDNANMDIQADKNVNSEDGEPCEIVPMTAEDGDSAEELQNAEENNGNEKLCKIEPTTAEAEALSKGLQTIKNDDLEEIRQLGSGTFGFVYYGKWRGSDVAIKRIKASCFAGRPSERERLCTGIADFWKEALIMSHLHHPNIVSFYGVVRDGPDGCLATVTEFMVNGSLKQFLQKKDRTIDRRKRLIIAMDVAFGMEYLHGKNIVHFDLKCENLLVNMRDPHRPVCKIGDLGLSKVKQHTLVSGGLRGTLPWMAPELLSGKSNMVSEKIDVYSYGIVMWELLTGEEPYADMRCASIIGGIVNNDIRPKIPTWCDPEWKSLMESCWSSDPASRPSFSEISKKLRKMAAAINLK